jgi:hypothetical protein
MATADRTPIAWRDATVILLGAEALAVAVWLAPASIHIVKWPASGPIRLALLSPAWQLLAWSVGAMALALAAIVGARASRRAAPTLVFAPLVGLWLWLIPYLPWIPDRWPLFLVLAGPLRWVIACAAVISILLNTTRLPAALARLLLIDRRTVFAVSLALYLGFGLYSARETGVGGDEPHYLVITESLLRDHDLKIENNHQQGDYRAFYPGELRPDFFERGKNGEIYSIHAPGLPVLILPAYAAAGRFGVVALMALIAALTMRAVFVLAEQVAGRPPAVLTWLASGFTVPFIPHAWMIFPELPGALLVAWGALWVLETTERSPGRWAWRGVALSLLPWLHTKFIVFLAIFGAAVAWRLLRRPFDNNGPDAQGRPRALVAFALPAVVLTALWFYSFYAIYGSFNPEAPYGSYTGIYVLTSNIPHGLLGLFFDQKFGLFFYSPIYLASVAGAWLMLGRPDTRFLCLVLLATIAAFVGSTARLYMFWGGSSAPARFLVPLLPCLAPLVATAFAHAKHAISRAVLGLWLGISIVVAIAAVVQPGRFMLFSDAHVGGARVLEAIQGSAPLADAAPMFTNPDWASHLGQLALWSLAAAVALAILVVVSRLTQGAGPWRLAGLAAVTFLAAGAVLAAAPAEDGRQSVAERGDLDVLWRFDGNRFRTLDYQTLTRTSPERFRELTTIEINAQPSEVSDAGYTAGPLSLPPGTFDARVWFSGAAARDGEVLVAALPRATFGRRSGSLTNPTSIPFELPVAIRRLSVRVADRRVAESVSRFEIVPVAVVPALERHDIPVRSIESLDARTGAYLIYTDEHAYPEGPVFWSRGTAETRLWVAPAGASKMLLKLSTGPKSGAVTLTVDGQAKTVVMQGGEVKDLAFDLPSGRQIVPLTVQSTVMFRPAEADAKSTDMRGLGCQVRIDLE